MLFFITREAMSWFTILSQEGSRWASPDLDRFGEKSVVKSDIVALESLKMIRI